MFTLYKEYLSYKNSKSVYSKEDLSNIRAFSIGIVIH